MNNDAIFSFCSAKPAHTHTHTLFFKNKLPHSAIKSEDKNPNNFSCANAAGDK